jgi:hypothetical protein
MEHIKTETVTGLASELRNLTSEVDPLKRDFQNLKRDFATWVPTKLDFPMTKPDIWDGIISYLSRKHRNHVHSAGIVTITSQWLSPISLYFVSGYNSCWPFWSADEPDQWICWDFGKMRIRPTQYTILGARLKSWVIEGSVDGENWNEIDRQTDHDFGVVEDDSGLRGIPALIDFWNPMECRFIRLSQTDNDNLGDVGGRIGVQAMEFFGTLSE